MRTLNRYWVDQAEFEEWWEAVDERLLELDAEPMWRKQAESYWSQSLTVHEASEIEAQRQMAEDARRDRASRSPNIPS